MRQAGEKKQSDHLTVLRCPVTKGLPTRMTRFGFELACQTQMRQPDYWRSSNGQRREIPRRCTNCRGRSLPPELSFITIMGDTMGGSKEVPGVCELCGDKKNLRGYHGIQACASCGTAITQASTRPEIVVKAMQALYEDKYFPAESLLKEENSELLESYRSENQKLADRLRIWDRLFPEGANPEEIMADLHLRIADLTAAAQSGVPGYEKLAEVLAAAYDQAAKGKGKERHADNKPFHEQQICQIIRDEGAGFPRGQAKKKIDEAKRLDPAAAERELLGAINYLAAYILVLREGDATIPQHHAV